jgi:tetratricopeptide (TPR) repeat protein
MQIARMTRRLKSAAIYLTLLGILALLIYTTASRGYAARLASRAEANNDLASAARATQLSPNNADTHVLLGALFEANDDLTAALPHYRVATSLRSQDYVLQLQLARALELARQNDEAIRAARNAVVLAPFYALPRWQLGNMLVRAGRREEGFRELRLAATADPALLPAVIDLAAQLWRSEPDAITRAIQPQNAATYIQLGDYLKAHGQIAAAIQMLAAAGSKADAVRARSDYVGELISKGKFKDAYGLWGADHRASPESIVNPYFEREGDLDEPGFDWRRLNPSPAIVLSLDSNMPHDSPSLRVDFKGDSEPSIPVIAQLVLVQPNSSYQLDFVYQSKQLVSGGLPQLTVVDAGNNELLAHSPDLNSPGWTKWMLKFQSGPAVEAIQISLQRRPCEKSPCPIFGRLWLDSFALAKQVKRQK